MKYTVIVQWKWGLGLPDHPNDPYYRTNLTFQEAINIVNNFDALGKTEDFRCVTIQPMTPVDTAMTTKRHFTADELRAA